MWSWRQLPLYVLLILSAASANERDRKAILFGGQQANPDGLMHFSPNMFDEFASGKPREYSVVMMLKAEHLMEKKALFLSKVLAEFKLAAKAYKEKYATGARKGKVFFATLEYKESSHLFQRLGIEALPIIIRFPPQMNIRRTGKIDIGEDDRMTTRSHPDYPWTAEIIAEFVKTRTGLGVEEIPRYSMMQSKYFLPGVIGALVLGAFVSYNLYYSPFMQNQWIYILGSMGVCWFATSGGLFNIIRGVPFAVPHRDGSLQMFYPGPSQQLGAEGFLAGTAYVIFSSMVLMSIYAVPKIQGKSARRLSYFLFLAVGFAAMRQIVLAYAAKTGYKLQQYIF